MFRRIELFLSDIKFRIAKFFKFIEYKNVKVKNLKFKFIYLKSLR